MEWLRPVSNPTTDILTCSEWIKPNGQITHGPASMSRYQRVRSWAACGSVIYPSLAAMRARRFQAAMADCGGTQLVCGPTQPLVTHSIIKPRPASPDGIVIGGFPQNGHGNISPFIVGSVGWG